ncbi:MAG: hypothetical protein ACYTFV_11015 [Planctomycetota bacterium]|jgi:hypothetical protein
MLRTRLLLPLLAAPLLGGCFLSRTYVNDSIDPAVLESFQPLVTSAADVVAALGAPTQVVELGNRSAYAFEHRQLKRTGLFLLVVGLLNEDTRSDRVWVFFDEQDRLTHIGATLTADEVRYSLPWSSR